MIQSLFRYLKGYVKIRITGYSPERFLNMCCFHGIRIWELKSVGNAYEMYISLAGFRKLRPFARKTHMRIYVTQRNGFPFFVQSYRHRGALFAGRTQDDRHQFPVCIKFQSVDNAEAVS